MFQLNVYKSCALQDKFTKSIYKGLLDLYRDMSCLVRKCEHGTFLSEKNSTYRRKARTCLAPSLKSNKTGTQIWLLFLL
jgi:hypothetical protein